MNTRKLNSQLKLVDHNYNVMIDLLTKPSAHTPKRIKDIDSHILNLQRNLETLRQTYNESINQPQMVEA